MKIEQIIKANKATGSHFFDDGTMSFFASRVHPRTFGAYFVTSEKTCFDNYTRCYSVRRAMPDGSIDTIGDVGSYATLKVAYAAAKAHYLATRYAATA